MIRSLTAIQELPQEFLKDSNINKALLCLSFEIVREFSLVLLSHKRQMIDLIDQIMGIGTID